MTAIGGQYGPTAPKQRSRAGREGERLKKKISNNRAFGRTVLEVNDRLSPVLRSVFGLFERLHRGA